MHGDNQHNPNTRSVIGVAHEVRLRMHDSRVIFCSVISPQGSGAATFVVRPWGVNTPTTIHYDDVRRAASVTTMVWKRQQAISRAQLAGIFVD